MTKSFKQRQRSDEIRAIQWRARVEAIQVKKDESEKVFRDAIQLDQSIIDVRVRVATSAAEASAALAPAFVPQTVYCAKTGAPLGQLSAAVAAECSVVTGDSRQRATCFNGSISHPAWLYTDSQALHELQRVMPVHYAVYMVCQLTRGVTPTTAERAQAFSVLSAFPMASTIDIGEACRRILAICGQIIDQRSKALSKGAHVALSDVTIYGSESVSDYRIKDAVKHEEQIKELVGIPPVVFDQIPDSTDTADFHDATRFAKLAILEQQTLKQASERCRKWQARVQSANATESMPPVLPIQILIGSASPDDFLAWLRQQLIKYITASQQATHADHPYLNRAAVLTQADVKRMSIAAGKLRHKKPKKKKNEDTEAFLDIMELMPENVNFTMQIDLPAARLARKVHGNTRNFAPAIRLNKPAASLLHAPITSRGMVALPADGSDIVVPTTEQAFDDLDSLFDDASLLDAQAITEVALSDFASLMADQYQAPIAADVPVSVPAIEAIELPAPVASAKPRIMFRKKD